MCLGSQLSLFKIFRHSYSILTEYEYTKFCQDQNPGADFRPYYDKADRCSKFMTNEWLAKLGDESIPGQTLSADADGLRKRRLSSLNDLQWTDIVEVWPPHPGLDKSTLPSDMKLKSGPGKLTTNPLFACVEPNLKAAERIKLLVDLSPYFTEKSQVPREKIKGGGHFIKYKIFVQLLHGEKAEYCVQFFKPGEKQLSSMPLLQSPVDLTTLYEIGSCPRRITTDGSSVDDQVEASAPKIIQQSLLESATASTQLRTEMLHQHTATSPTPTETCQDTTKLKEIAAGVHNFSIFDTVPVSPPPPGIKAAPRRGIFNNLSTTPTAPRPKNLTDLGIPGLSSSAIAGFLAPKDANAKIGQSRTVQQPENEECITVEVESEPDTAAKGRALRSKKIQVEQAEGEPLRKVRFAPL
ncbi:uncharacterized protein LY89DRAFT_779998 [Mollisia scopiformis]|uniref:Uncharacterized protein n=1 Tax=Mollisia scopiformis TaxID=149040 RepID=A0A194XJ21_MOLSC|nr:uncharacterized protein LY89DRAFT_779998 [Mollisia scopiformis]KUJ20158.1 hypothetical protein LY89DRAFT_779998 [Mollisia scopiformis]